MSKTEGEQALFDESAKLATDLQYGLWDGAKVCRRAFHAKSHGALKATFRIDDTVDDDLRVGLFARSGEVYDSWIRYSNGQSDIGEDATDDTRGMAIKLTGVNGPKCVNPGADVGAPETDEQDFLLIAGGSSFFVGDAEEYIKLQQKPDIGSYFTSPTPVTTLPKRAAWLTRLVACSGVKLTTPATPTYYSLAPYALGTQDAMRFRIRPEFDYDGPDPSDDPDFLRKALATQLSKGGIRLRFEVQKRVDPMPIEDWTMSWPELLSAYRPVATIFIEPQDFDTEERRALGESLSFNPWNALKEHQPLGQMGRMRGCVYAASAKLRAEQNAD